MKTSIKLLFQNENNEKFFGEGPCRLLRAVEKTGSLHAAAQSMDMAYTKALKILKNAENALGFSLTARAIGGRNGGGSQLTPEGLAFLEKYEACRDACADAGRAVVRRYFPRIGCVIMASGQGKRFGGNKLMADFMGEPLICRALQVSEGIFDRRVVVTRHADVAGLCRERGAEVVLHDMPLRSDTVRLGLQAAGDIDACLFLPGDQPLLRRETIAALVRRWEEERNAIWRTACGDAPGSPVVFPAWAFEELLHLPDGSGGGHLLRKYPDRVRCMQVDDPRELMDVDTPQQLAQLLEAGDPA